MGVRDLTDASSIGSIGAHGMHAAQTPRTFAAAHLASSTASSRRFWWQPVPTQPPTVPGDEPSRARVGPVAASRPTPVSVRNNFCHRVNHRIPRITRAPFRSAALIVGV